MKVKVIRECHPNDFAEEWENLKKNKFYGLSVSLVHPRYILDPSSPCEPFTMSETSINDWSVVTAKLNSEIDLDSEHDFIRQQSEERFNKEIGLAAYLGSQAVIINVRNKNCSNLASSICRVLKKTLYGQQFWVEILLNNSDYNKKCQNENPWLIWNKLRWLGNFQSRIGVALEIGPNVQHIDDEDFLRWRGENVKCIVLSTSTFLTNAKGFPVLSKKHQKFIRKLAPLNPSFILKGHAGNNDLIHFVQYLENLIATSSELNYYTLGNPETRKYFRDFEEELQIPLQPLKHNLDKCTYDVFLRDPVKYVKYTEAIKDALIDRVPETEKETMTVIMVVGAGAAGPLVDCALVASKESGRPVRIYAIEKNEYAVIGLKNKKQTIWGDYVNIVSSDMRKFQPPELADILISELLGSFGDNELSPECLNGAQHLLKSDGISIPQEYSSWIRPTMASRSWMKLSEQLGKTEDFQKGYVVLQVNNYHPSESKKLFTFRHPSRGDDAFDNARTGVVKFIAKEDCVLHGVNGYFDTILYKDVVLSIVPETHSLGMFSWFPMFFPFMYPVAIKKGDSIKIQFWRKVSERYVWYEYTLLEPQFLPIHNVNGKIIRISLQ